jgi:hypothetical protein
MKASTMPSVRLLARTVQSIKPPASGRVEYWDKDLHGFGLRVSETGRKSWVAIYRHNGLSRRVTLCSYPTVSLADAREKAQDVLRTAARGVRRQRP